MSIVVYNAIESGYFIDLRNMIIQRSIKPPSTGGISLELGGGDKTPSLVPIAQVVVPHSLHTEEITHHVRKWGDEEGKYDDMENQVFQLYTNPKNYHLLSEELNELELPIPKVCDRVVMVTGVKTMMVRKRDEALQLATIEVLLSCTYPTPFGMINSIMPYFITAEVLP